MERRIEDHRSEVREEITSMRESRERRDVALDAQLRQIDLTMSQVQLSLIRSEEQSKHNVQLAQTVQEMAKEVMTLKMSASNVRFLFMVIGTAAVCVGWLLGTIKGFKEVLPWTVG